MTVQEMAEVLRKAISEGTGPHVFNCRTLGEAWRVLICLAPEEREDIFVHIDKSCLELT